MIHEGYQNDHAARRGASRWRVAATGAWPTALTVLALSTSSTAQEPPLVTEYPCGYVEERDGEVYWEAMPSERLFVPVYYTAAESPGPRAQDVLAQLTIEVEDETGTTIQGGVTDVQQLSNWLLTWTPEVPFEPGQYTGHVRGGEFPEPIECGPGYNFGGIEYTRYSFQFSVEEAWQEWVDGAEFMIRDAGGGGGAGCCEVVDGECSAAAPCFQCWDSWWRPVVHGLWTGRGIPYLALDLQSESPNLVVSSAGPQLGVALGRSSEGAFTQYALVTDFGDYCIQGIVTAAGAESRSIEACGSLTEEDYEERAQAPQEECRTRVRATTCETMPAGMNALSTLYVVRGSSEEEASAALAAAPYHVLEGCLSNDSPSTPGDASTPVTRPDGGSIASAPDASRSDAGTEPDTTQGEADASMMSAPSTSRPDAGSSTSTAPPRGDSGKPIPVLFEDPSYGDCGCRIANRGRGAPSRWALLAVLAGLALRRRAKPWKTSR